MIRHLILLLLLVLIAAPTIAACGKKPTELESPPGEQSDFPRRYPR